MELAEIGIHSFLRSFIQYLLIELVLCAPRVCWVLGMWLTEVKKITALMELHSREGGR